MMKAILTKEEWLIALKLILILIFALALYLGDGTLSIRFGIFDYGRF